MDCVLAISEERKPVMEYLRASSPSSFLLFCITASHFFIPFIVEATHDSLGFVTGGLQFVSCQKPNDIIVPVNLLEKSADWFLKVPHYQPTLNYNKEGEMKGA